MRLLLAPVINHPTLGTFSTLLVKGRQFFFVERPWANNDPFVSCLPAGRYTVVWRPTTTKVPAEFEGHTWYLVGPGVSYRQRDGVPRWGCAWHIANEADEVEGCQGPGLGLSLQRDKWAVTSSRLALLELRDLLPSTFDLEVARGYAVPELPRVATTG